MMVPARMTSLALMRGWPESSRRANACKLGKEEKGRGIAALMQRAEQTTRRTGIPKSLAIGASKGNRTSAATVCETPDARRVTIKSNCAANNNGESDNMDKAAEAKSDKSLEA